MFARVSRFQDHPDNLDKAERLAEEQIVPQAGAIPGFAGVMSLIDRTTGRSMAITFWDTEDALRASEAEADRLRRETGELTDAEIVSVERYELVLRVGV